jgi:hypothetical protein
LIQFVCYAGDIHGHSTEWKPKIERLSERAKKLASSVVPLIEKYELERFAKK